MDGRPQGAELLERIRRRGLIGGSLSLWLAKNISGVLSLNLRTTKTKRMRTDTSSASHYYL